MGDDAELWIESGGDSTTLISDDYWSYCQYKSNKSLMKKKKTMVFIDAESVSANHCQSIIGQCKNVGEIFEMRYYALQKEMKADLTSNEFATINPYNTRASNINEISHACL